LRRGMTGVYPPGSGAGSRVRGNPQAENAQGENCSYCEYSRVLKHCFLSSGISFVDADRFKKVASDFQSSRLARIP